MEDAIKKLKLIDKRAKIPSAIFCIFLAVISYITTYLAIYIFNTTPSYKPISIILGTIGCSGVAMAYPIFKVLVASYKATRFKEIETLEEIISKNK